jgi:tetratricopeptide repeat protein 21B
LISFQNGNINSAYSSLEQAISNNFNIRENPLFMLVKGEIELKNHDIVTALTTLKTAFDLPGVGKTELGKKKKKGQSFQILSFDEKERCRIFVLYARALLENKQLPEAKAIMNDAIRTFSGTTEEGTVLMANAEIAVAGGDIQKALSILRAVDSKSPYFVEAKRLMADIYLKNLLDRRHFAKCYIDLVDASPTFENYKMLGEAFFKIQEPEDAIQAYEGALKMNNNDEEIIRQIGRALVLTHNYDNAMKYYEDALKADPNRLDLRLELGKLCIMINKFDKAEECLKLEIFGDEYNTPTSQALRRNVEGLVQISKLTVKKLGRVEGKPLTGAKEALQKALAMQSNLIERVKQESGNVEEERKNLAEIYFELGKYLIKYEKNDKKALECYEASLKQNPDNEKILMKLAELNSELGFKPQAETRLQQVLKLNPYHEDASNLLSELLMIKGEPEKAIELFKKILVEKPSYYHVLANLIDYMRKCGQFQDIKGILEKVQKKCPNPNDPGLCFCKGLFFKYSRNAKEALNEFIKAKRGSQFCAESIINMIDIYLNPDQELMYTSLQSDGGVKQVDPENLKAADNLVKELAAKYPGPIATIQEAYVYMFTKGKMDRVHEKLQEVLTQKGEFIPALLASAIGRSIQGKQSDAKNTLKILAKKGFCNEYSEELEKAWLLQADYMIYNDNFNEADEMLKRCNRYNLSCGKAEEYLGLIDEKKQNFKGAAEHYERAWKLCMQKSPSIGYRLAFNYLKSKKYIECIDICKNILQTYPDFQKIEKEVLSKARAALRV